MREVKFTPASYRDGEKLPEIDAFLPFEGSFLVVQPDLGFEGDNPLKNKGWTLGHIATGWQANPAGIPVATKEDACELATILDGANTKWDFAKPKKMIGIFPPEVVERARVFIREHAFERE